MKRLLLSLACLSALACGVPATGPPGMPLDQDLLPESDDTAVTKLSR